MMTKSAKPSNVFPVYVNQLIAWDLANVLWGVLLAVFALETVKHVGRFSMKCDDDCYDDDDDDDDDDI